MKIESLTLRGFRNYENLSLEFDPGVNLILGDNAQGKTNLLEAISYLGSGRSFRAQKNAELIRFGSAFGEVEGRVFSQEREQTLRFLIFPGSRPRQIFRNGAKKKTLSEIAGVLPTVLFCPEDLMILKLGAGQRRRFGDSGLCQLRPNYDAALTEYHRILEQKSRILKDYHENPGLLEILPEYNARLCQVGALLISYRARYYDALGNAYIRTLVDQVVNDQLTIFFEEHPQIAKAVLEKAMMANRAREAARKARESIRRKTGLESGQMPDKLQDCNERNPELCEIYIVEGDSAAGSAIQGRDSRFQAILAMWGKMLNVEKARADKIYGNDKLYPLIVALGAGIGDEFDLEKLRYHKVVIMSDADVDGAHIRTLLLTFFFRYMRPLIENGYVYSAVPPLYKLTRGRTTKVAYSDDQRDQISAQLRSDNANAKVDISRFKGLGEMDPHELWETTMDPEKRTLRRITLEDARRADEIFTVLMGEQVEPRKDWIERNAKYAVNLDF